MPRNHGTRTCYVNEECRCVPCTEANTAYHRELVERLAADTNRTPHGTDSGYVNWRCRCEKCSAAHWTPERKRKGAEASKRFADKKRKAAKTAKKVKTSK